MEWSRIALYCVLYYIGDDQLLNWKPQTLPSIDELLSKRKKNASNMNNNNNNSNNLTVNNPQHKKDSIGSDSSGSGGSHQLP